MNRFENFTRGTTDRTISHSAWLPNGVAGYKPLMWLMALLLAAIVAGCGGGGGSSAPGSAKAITAYTLAGVTGTINETAKTIAVTVPNGTDVTALVATFTTTGASVKVGTTVQTSATTANNFTSPVVYTVTAADATTATYTVTVTVAQNSAKAITDYSLAGVTGTINETAKAIAVSVPYGTNITALAAAFTTTGASVKIGTTAQTSGITLNDFTSPVTYAVTAGDSTTATYTVTVTVAQNFAKAITAYSLDGVTGTINETAKTIAVTMPFGTDVTTLVATFTTTGTGPVKVGGVAQTSATTVNDFTNPVAYTVTAANTTTATYIVTVTVAQNSAKAISVYSLAGVTGTIDETAKTIAVTVPSGTNVTALVATFTTTGVSVKVGTTVQTSAATANDFTSPVDYIVTAADTTSATYTVTVTVAAPVATGVCTGTVTDCVDLKTAANFVILTKAGITDVPASPITGNIGTSSITGASITVPCTDMLTGQVYTDDTNYSGFTCTSTDKTMAGLAVGDMGAAYTAAAGKVAVPGSCPGVGAMSDVNDAGALAPGVYTCAVDVTIPGDLTLNGNATDVWVFQITGKLTQSSATTVHLTGGALAQNVFWQVSDVVEVGTTAHIEGVILAQTAIHMLTGSSINGRLLAQTAVTLDTATVIQP